VGRDWAVGSYVPEREEVGWIREKGIVVRWGGVYGSMAESLDWLGYIKVSVCTCVS
jgi:hypothetical protein